MIDVHVRYLLVGGGVASSAAARAVRRIDGESSMLLVGQEVAGPYHRPPLSKGYLLGKQSRQDLFAMDPAWFAENKVTLRTGRRAAHLDPGRHLVTLDSGEAVAFDRLLLATGSSPRRLTVPGADLPNVHYLRTLGDADRIHNAVEKAKLDGPGHTGGGRGRVVVIGGGLLGVELAGTFAQLDLGVDLVVPAPHPWAKYAGETTGRFLTRLLESRGVRVHAATTALRLEGDGRVQRVALSNGTTVPSDFVVAAVGVEPHNELLRGTSIAAEKAILADAAGRTSAEDIFAAGDCAAIFDPLFGKYRRLAHWDSASATGAIAGANMAGADESYRAVSRFVSVVTNVSLSVWGEHRAVERRLFRGALAPEAANFVEFGIAADGRIAQVLAVGNVGTDATLAELVRRRLNVAGREESLKDPAVPLETVLAEAAI